MLLKLQYYFSKERRLAQLAHELNVYYVFALTINCDNSFGNSLQVAGHAFVLSKVLLIHLGDVHRHVELVLASLFLRHI